MLRPEVNRTLTKTTRVVIGILVLGAAAYVLGRWLRSDETRIRELIDAMAAGFNDASPSSTVAGLDAAFVDSTTGATQQDVHNALRWLCLTARQETTRAFIYQVVIDQVKTQLAADRQQATSVVRATFHERKDDTLQSVWKVSLSCELVKTEGWKITRCAHKTLAGKRLY